MDSLSLPVEIVELILDEADGDDPTLDACSLVCRDWLPLSQRRKFQSVTLQSDSHVSRANQLFMESPHLITHIRHLGIVDLHSAINTGNYGYGHRWSNTIESSDLPPVLETLATKGSLAGLCVSPGEGQRWSGLSTELQVALQKLLRSPTLGLLEFANVRGIPIGIITSPPALKELVLQNVTFATITPINAVTQDDGLRPTIMEDSTWVVRILRLEADEYTLQMIAHYLREQRVRAELHQLTVHCYKLLEATSRFCVKMGCEKTLRSLHLTTSRGWEDLERVSVTNLSAYQELRELSVDVCISPPELGSTPLALWWVVNSLKTLPHRPLSVIVKIFLTVLGTRCSFDSQFNREDLEVWDNLDMVMAELKRRKLTTVQVVLVVHMAYSQGPIFRGGIMDFDETVEALKARLVGCGEALLFENEID